MGTYPWGPHGPQTGPHEVTPNPTPPYVPPAWEDPAPAPAPASYGAQPTYGGGPVTYSGPAKARPKSYLIAIICAAIFGPLGLFYATGKGGLVMLLVLVGVPVGLTALGHAPGAYEAGNPLSIIGNDAVMNRMWSICAFISVIWSVIAVMSYNRAVKARNKALA